MLWVLALISFAVTFAALKLLLARFARLALDQPNERSLHERPVPRTGGIALLAGAAISFAFGAVALWLPLGLAVVLALLSFADDLQSLPTAARLAAHLAVAALAVWYLLSPMHPAELALLVLVGAGHRGTALLGYGLMAICAGAALYARTEAPAVQAAVVVPAAVALIAAAAWIDVRWSRHERRAAP